MGSLQRLLCTWNVGNSLCEQAKMNHKLVFNPARLSPHNPDAASHFHKPIGQVLLMEMLSMTLWCSQAPFSMI